MEAATLTYDAISVGHTATLTKTVSTQDIATFANLTGDYNPLHTDPVFAATTKFGKNISHGLLVQSLFSTIAGMHLPGKHSLILEVSSQFRKPVFAGDTVTVTATVARKMDAGKLIFLELVVTNQQRETVITGKMTIGVQA